MKGDLKADIDDGVENTQKKVKTGVEYLKPGGAVPVERLTQSGDPPEPAPEVSRQRRPMSKHTAPDAQSAEPNQQSKWVPKYCPYCGGPLTGLFSCGDVGTSQSSDIDEGNNNVEEEASGLNEPPPELAPQRKPTQQNVQTPEAGGAVEVHAVGRHLDVAGRVERAAEPFRICWIWDREVPASKWVVAKLHQFVGRLS